MSAALLELAVHMGVELYAGDIDARKRYVDWYIETNGGTHFEIKLPKLVTGDTLSLKEKDNAN